MCDQRICVFQSFRRLLLDGDAVLVELAVHVPQVLEVLDGPDLEVEGGVLVADHQGSRVLLEG